MLAGRDVHYNLTAFLALCNVGWKEWPLPPHCFPRVVQCWLEGTSTTTTLLSSRGAMLAGRDAHYNLTAFIAWFNVGWKGRPLPPHCFPRVVQCWLEHKDNPQVNFYFFQWLMVGWKRNLGWHCQCLQAKCLHSTILAVTYCLPTWIVAGNQFGQKANLASDALESKPQTSVRVKTPFCQHQPQVSAPALCGWWLSKQVSMVVEDMSTRHQSETMFCEWKRWGPYHQLKCVHSSHQSEPLQPPANGVNHYCYCRKLHPPCPLHHLPALLQPKGWKLASQVPSMPMAPHQMHHRKTLEAFGPVCTTLITAIWLLLALSLTMLCSMTGSTVKSVGSEKLFKMIMWDICGHLFHHRFPVRYWNMTISQAKHYVMEQPWSNSSPDWRIRWFNTTTRSKKLK